jgi:hypothetical protein
MTEENKKTLLESLLSICLEGSKSLADDFPKWGRPLFRVLIFCLILLSSLIIAPVVLVVRLFSKSKVDPFFKLRTELETKWYGGAQDEALTELRNVRTNLLKNEYKLFFQGVQIPPYGKFKFDEFTNVLWLLYHWEFHSGNFQEASIICDYVIEKCQPKNFSDKTSNSYWEEWVLNKAKAINIKNGTTATQEYLLKLTDPKNVSSRISAAFLLMTGVTKELHKYGEN